MCHFKKMFTLESQPNFKKKPAYFFVAVENMLCQHNLDI